jgi:hypothetical protein
MSLILQPAVKENASQRAEVQLASYGDDPILTSLMAGVPYEEQVKFFAGALFQGFGEPGVKDLEVLDSETGLVIDFLPHEY